MGKTLLQGLIEKKTKELEDLTVIDAWFTKTTWFYQTGSRFFGGFTEGSDDDYFISESSMKSLFPYFEKLGFRVKHHSHSFEYSLYGGDPSISYILEYGSIIDIQVIKDSYFERKLKAQDKYKELILTVPGYLSSMSNRQKSNLWRTLIMLS